jgi:hypothetical protein
MTTRLKCRRDASQGAPVCWSRFARLTASLSDLPKKGKGMAQVAEWQAKDFARILHVVPGLVHFPAKQVWIDSDAEADVLYRSFCKPQRAPPTASCATMASSCIAAARRSSA